MELHSNSFANNEPMPDSTGFGIPDPENHMTLGQNLNPHLRWSNVPTNAKTLVLLCNDPDVPTIKDNINQEGKVIPADMPRTNFCHWIMVDIPATDGEIVEGACSSEVTPGGKRNPAGPAGSRQGLNDFTRFMAGNPEMQGEYFGWDGACPPWNDELVHKYDFILYATDIERCPVEGAFNAADAATAITGHVLAEARLCGTYTLNPDLR
jgi:Raf kinase inhibitor-like YbhB/YbcL family protein